MDKKGLFRWVSIIAILASGLIHLYDAPGEFQEAPYMGVLFTIYFLASIISVVGIYRRALVWGWMLGTVLAITAILGYLLSRTVGLPIMGKETWGPPLGYVSIILELVYFVPFFQSKSMYVRRAL